MCPGHSFVRSASSFSGLPLIQILLESNLSPINRSHLSSFGAQSFKYHWPIKGWQSGGSRLADWTWMGFWLPHDSLLSVNDQVHESMLYWGVSMLPWEFPSLFWQKSGAFMNGGRRCMCDMTACDLKRPGFPPVSGRVPQRRESVCLVAQRVKKSRNVRRTCFFSFKRKRHQRCTRTKESWIIARGLVVWNYEHKLNLFMYRKTYTLFLG